MESREVEEIKRHFDVVAESLRSDIKAVADNLSVLNRKIDNLHEELIVLREENAKEHKAMMEWIEKEHQKMREESEKRFKALMEWGEREHGKMMERNEEKHKLMMEENRKEHQEIISKLDLSYTDLHRRMSILENK